MQTTILACLSLQCRAFFFFFFFQEFGGRVLKVNFPQAPTREPRMSSYNDSPPPRREGGGGYNNSPNKLFVGNLSWNVDDISLETIFSDYGKVLEAKVISDRETGKSRGFGFVTLASATEVNEAINNLDGAVSLSSNGYPFYVVLVRSNCDQQISVYNGNHVIFVGF